jgi:hypothetical protein
MVVAVDREPWTGMAINDEMSAYFTGISHCVRRRGRSTHEVDRPRLHEYPIRMTGNKGKAA